MSKEAAAEVKPPSTLAAILNLLPLLILTWYLCQNKPKPDPSQLLQACGKNLHKMGVEVEKYRLLSDDKLYPPELDKVFKEGEMPACPVGGAESYTNGFTLLDGRSGYLLVCKGKHHVDASVPSDYPRIAFSVEEASQTDSATEVKEKEEVDASQEPKIEASPVEGEAATEDSEQEGTAIQEQEPRQEEPLFQESPSPATTAQPD